MEKYVILWFEVTNITEMFFSLQIIHRFIIDTVKIRVDFKKDIGDSKHYINYVKLITLIYIKCQRHSSKNKSETRRHFPGLKTTWTWHLTQLQLLRQ
jgi:hypothetical protein